MLTNCHNQQHAQGQDDELELDIEKISNEVLLKLLDLVLKHTNHRLPVDVTAFAAQESAQPATKAAAPKARKKNKPMSKREQEQKIQHLQKLKSQLAGGQSGGGGNGGGGGSGSGSQEPIPSIERDHNASSEEEDDEPDSEED